MIQKLEIKGFRSLRDVTWSPGKLNVVVGPNGSGKSNLLRALAFLQCTAQGGLPAEILRQGGIIPLLWDGQVQDLSFRLMTDPLGAGGDSVCEALTYELRLRQLGGSSAYRIEHEMLTDQYLVDSGEGAVPKIFLARVPASAVVFGNSAGEHVAREGSVTDDQTFLPLAAGPFSDPAVVEFRNLLLSWGIYHDLHVDRDAPIRHAAVARIEKRIDANGQNLIPYLHTLYTTDRSFKSDIDAAMRAAFGDDFEELSFPPAADQRVQLRLRWRSLQSAQSASDLSDGTIRFLLLLAILANPTPGALIAIDEPEVGLHPGMLPIVAEFAQQAAEHCQVVLTTHSPQLLDAFPADDAPTTTVARWCDGATQLSVLDGDELKRWLGEYSMGALFRSQELEGMA